MRQAFEFIAMTPSGLANPTLAIAASRAGAFGLLNLDFTTPSQAAAAIDRLTRYSGDGLLGVRFDAHDQTLIAALHDRLSPPLTTVVLTATADAALVEQLAARGLAVWIEVTDVAQARRAAELGASALIAKGHEAGGWVGEETTFILLQRILHAVALPVYALGGIGLHTVAAVKAAGAAGVVLDGQLALLRESPLPAHVKQLIPALDGSETIVVGGELGASLRVFYRPQVQAVKALQAAAVQIDPADRAGWRQAVADRLGWGALGDSAWPLGQDIAFAAGFAERFRSVAGVIRALTDSIDAHVAAVLAERPLAPNSRMSGSHSTYYPIVQGPMTRVSDTPEFALAVAQGGGLPFLALALMRAEEVEPLLAATQAQLGDRPWGVGVLGFVPLELRREQMDVVRRYRPPFAIIAGGRPDQALALEQDGIATYLHVPSPRLLESFIADGARRFIFEGKECGGHIGPRSSFVLWEQMVETLLAHLPADADRLHILFAGGIHDALSAAMVATLAAPLAARGVKIGVLMGTGYLFTAEAVASGAILPTFQQAAVAADHTVTVESGAGHAIRCIENPFTREFATLKRDLLQQGLTADSVREKLDALNIGRLRIASKGITRHPDYRRAPGAPKYLELDAAEQYAQGMYMIGQLAALRDSITTIADLHGAVCDGSDAIISRLGQQAVQTPEVPAPPAAVAIIGIECLLPGAQDRAQYWENIVNAVYAIGEVPAERWPLERYFDADRRARDRIYSRWGGFLADVPFDPLEFGMPPNALTSIDPMQLLALKVAKLALADAGYADGHVDHRNTGVILGCSGGLGDVGSYYLARSFLPLVVGEAADAVVAAADWLPEWTEDSFAGLLPNVAAGRIANRLNFGAVNYVVDAACGSSLAAVHLAVKELNDGMADMIVVGGVDTIQSPFGYLCFSKTGALTPGGVPRVFDRDADGIVISEGVVMLVLKRLADAERDGDNIYAVIQGAAGSSDGRALGLTAPRAEGQQLALERVYRRSGIDPTTVGLFEAHGTGTARGDMTETRALAQFLADHGAPPNRHPVGSVKSMIGHTKAAAGVAGLAKIALALRHKILPPTLNVSTPNPKAGFGSGPLYVNSAARPWLHSADHPRRAAVSAFGFGGTNFHVVVEEYTNDYLDAAPAPLQTRSHELLLFAAADRAALVAQLTPLAEALAAGAQPRLSDLAYTLWQQYDAAQPARLALVTRNLAELQAQIAAFAADQKQAGVLFAAQPLAGALAVLFPGQGAQYPDMLRDLTLHFPIVRATFEASERALAGLYDRPLGAYIFPPPAFDAATAERQAAELTATDVAQPALGAAGLAVYRLLQALGVQPALAAGHSYGEFVALAAAGVIDAADLPAVSAARGRAMLAATGADAGTMAAVAADPATIEPLLAGIADVWIANLNAPQRTIIAGSNAGIAQALEALHAAGLRAQPIEVAAAFHSPIVAPAQAAFADFLATIAFNEPQFDVYANGSGARHAAEPAAIRAAMTRHLAEQVRFVEQIEAMYAAGARIFVESGPQNILTRLVRQILGDRPHLAIAVDRRGEDGLGQFHHALAELIVHGVPLTLAPLFEGRQVRRLNLRRLVSDTQPPAPARTAWLLNGGAIRPQGTPPKLMQPASVSVGTPPTPAPPEPVAPVASVATPSTVGAPVAALSSAAGAHFVPHYEALMHHFLTTQRDVMLALLGQGGGSAAPPAPAVAETKIEQPVEPFVAPQHATAAAPPVPRSQLVWQPAPAPLPRARRFRADRPIVITDGAVPTGSPLAQALAQRIVAAGGQALMVDALPPADVRPGGIIHLLPLSQRQPFAARDLAGWQAANAQALKLLLPLTQRLIASGDDGFLLAATDIADQPQHAAVRGFCKTAAQELAPLAVRCVDFDATDDAAAIAERLWGELLADDREPVVAYRAGQRLIARQVAAPLPPAPQPLTIDRADVILVTGGGSGITAHVARALAARYRPTLVLLGRTPLPSAAESAATRDLHDAKAIKAALIAELRAAGEPFTLADVERRYAALLKERALRATLAALEASGATVRYHAVDVRDAAAMQLVIEMTQLEFGHITGVIHGAGIIEDKLIAEKSAASFARVFDTKADSLFLLTQLLDCDALRFMALFSSAAGALGNRGQADYAAANDLLNGVAEYLAAQHAGRFVALCWGPWAGDGMVAPALQAEFERLGIDLIGLEAGCNALIDELRAGAHADAVVIYAGGAWGSPPPADAGADVATAFAPANLPLLATAALGSEGGTLRATRTFDPARERYLDHHRLDGTPVLPLAIATEWLAELAQQTYPDLHVVGMRDLRVQAGVKFAGDRPRVLVASATAQRDPSYERAGVDVDVALSDPSSGRVHYRAVVELGDRLPPPPAYSDLPDLARPFPHAVATVYEQWLFHGPVFQAIRAIHGYTAEDLLLDALPCPPALALHDARGGWLIDPIVFDAGLQGALLWARHSMDVTPIPLGFRRLQRHAPLTTQPVRVHLRFLQDGTAQKLNVNLAFLDADGRLLLHVEGIDGQYTHAFNRLGGREQYRPLLLAL